MYKYVCTYEGGVKPTHETLRALQSHGHCHSMDIHIYIHIYVYIYIYRYIYRYI